MTALILAALKANWKPVLAGALVLALVGFWQWDRAAQYRAGQEAERTEARARAMELIEKRIADDVELSTADAAVLCRELGGNWRVHENRCD